MSKSKANTKKTTPPSSLKTEFSLVTGLVVSALFSMTLLVFGPAYIYFTNVLEFSFSFGGVLPWLGGAALLVCLLLLVLLWALRLRSLLYERGLALIVAISLLLWVQGNLMVWNYGPLDGRDIPWAKMWTFGLLDAGVWIILLLVALKKSQWFARQARNIAYALIALQMISLSIPMNRAPENASFKDYVIDETTKYEFSSQKNVIILMLDTYQTDFFQEIINEDETYKDIFKGFTYYRNMLAAFPKTYTSVPSFLTANAYDNSIPMVDFVKNAYASESSIPKMLREAGYRVELYPFPGTEKTIHFSEDVAANLKKRKSSGVKGKDLGFLLDLTLFRHLPHFSKRFVYNDQSWLLKRVLADSTSAPIAATAAGSNTGNGSKTAADSKAEGNWKPGTGQGITGIKDVPQFSKKALEQDDVRFIQQLLIRSVIGGDVPVFKYYHLNGLHRPIVLDANLNVKKMPYKERSSITEQGKACLNITRLMLETLKRLGIFENTMVIVMADHGCADYPYGVDIKSAGLQEFASGDGSAAASGSAIPSHIKAAALPMMLIKPFGAGDQEMKTSDAPVSLTDLPQTIADAVGIGKQLPGESMLALAQAESSEPSQRERRFYYYNWNGWGGGYLYHMREYIVSGHSWLDSSWRTGGIKQPANAATRYTYGTELTFGHGGNAMSFLGIGWHGPQKDGITWTREKKVELFFPVDAPQKDITLNMTLKPYLVPGKLDKQEITLYVNHQKIETLTVTDANFKTYSITIPKSAVTGKQLNIVLDIPTATAPVDLNIGTDVRTLGVAMKSITLD